MCIPHKSSVIRNCLSSSPASQHCACELAKIDKKVLLVHVRRGDIAIADMNALSREGLVNHSLEHNDKLIYALDGRLYTQEDISSSAHRYRYVNADKYRQALLNFLHGKSRNDYLVVLVSDGHDRLIRRIAESSDIKLQCSMTDLEKYFANELEDLVGLSDISFIGEQEDNLLATVRYIMMAQVILHGPSSMAVNLKSSICGTESYVALCIS